MATVVQLNETQLAQLRETPKDNLTYDQKVVFLEDGDTASLTFRRGRVGSVYSRPDRFSNAEGTLRSNVARVAQAGGSVSSGDRVVFLTGVAAGKEVEVISFAEGYVSARAQTYWGITETVRCSNYIILGEAREPEPERVIDPEELKLSQYWIDRIRETAKAAKKRHGLCSAIDKIVLELLEPVLPKWSFEESSVVDTENGGELTFFWLLSPKGERVTFFATQADVEKEVAARDKKETVL